METQLEPAPLLARAAAQPAGPKAACFTSWSHGHNNPSYVELFDRLGAVVDFHKVTFSRRRMVRALQYRVWTASSETVIYPVVFRILSRRYNTLFTVDPRQIPFWNKSVVVDMNDPTDDPAVHRLLKLPQVKAIVVSTERARKTVQDAGVAAPVHVIPQIVSVRLDPVDGQEIRARSRTDADVVAGYLAPGLSLASDGSRRWRQGMDDLDLLFAAVERARREEPRIRLWLLGVPTAAVRKYARGKSWITLFGYVPLSRVFSYISNFDIGVYPRTRVLPRGSFSVKLVQYMACGLPVASTTVEEALIVEEAKCGILCRSEHEFSRALISLARSPEMRMRLGAPGREYAKTHTAWSYLANYEGIIRDVLNRNGDEEASPIHVARFESQFGNPRLSDP